jgi:hypothetical protein
MTLPGYNSPSPVEASPQATPEHFISSPSASSEPLSTTASLSHATPCPTRAELPLGYLNDDEQDVDIAMGSRHSSGEYTTSPTSSSLSSPIIYTARRFVTPESSPFSSPHALSISSPGARTATAPSDMGGQNRIPQQPARLESTTSAELANIHESAAHGKFFMPPTPSTSSAPPSFEALRPVPALYEMAPPSDQAATVPRMDRIKMPTHSPKQTAQSPIAPYTGSCTTSPNMGPADCWQGASGELDPVHQWPVSPPPIASAPPPLCSLLQPASNYAEQDLPPSIPR